MRFTARTWIAILAALLLVLLVTSVWLRFSRPPQESFETSSSTQVDSSSTTIPVLPTPKPSVPLHTDTVPAPSSATLPPASPLMSPLDTVGLIIPVTGVKADQLTDTYTQARSNGRVHDAIDIMAPHNTAVIAAAAGSIARLFQSRFGGTTIYELSPDGHTVYYYAHLDHYADGLAQGKQVQQGQLLGYVGDTGDAGPGNYHLHFAIWLIQDPKKFWDGQNINPYPILKQAK